MSTVGHLGHGMGLEERIANLVRNLSEEKKQQLLDVLIEWQQNEQRDDERMSCLISVDYATNKRAYKDFIQDLSKGGVFIETRAAFAIGEVLSMTFNMPNTQFHFKVTGKIVRVDPVGIGIRLNHKLSSYQEDMIKKTVDPKK